MSTFKTTAERLHRICIKAQTSARHGLTLNRFGLICAMRGYRIIDGGGFIAIEPVAGLNETPIRIFKSKKMKSYEQIAESMYKKWQAALIRYRKPKPFAELEEHEQQAWIAAARAAHKEIMEVH